MPNPQSALIRSPLIASWREVYWATVGGDSGHHLSFNKWLVALLGAAIESYAEEWESQ